MRNSVFMLALAALAALAGCSEERPASAPQAPWPQWVFEHWVWEDESTQESALAHVNGYLERDIPVGALIIDSPWATGYNTFVWDVERFPDPRGLIDELHAKGVRVFLWIVPAINVDVPELYQHAAERGWFMRRVGQDGPAVVDWWKGDGSLIDLFNPAALAWWRSLVDQSLALGIDGWKCDGLDFAAITARYSPHLGRAVSRQEYSHAYYREFFDYTRGKLGDDRVITARPVDNYGLGVGGPDVAFAPVDINWAGWVGDQDATFDGMKAALNNMFYSSLLGYVSFGSDIGGYREDDTAPDGRGRTKELFLRWAQLGAFNPIMENGGGGEHRPWMFDEETVAIYRRFVALHHALIPYLMEQGAVAFSEKRSLMTFMEASIEQAPLDYEYYFLLGDDVFVAPMIESGTTRTVVFPGEGTWEYLFDRSKSFAAGSTATLEVPLSELPVFVRAGSDIAARIVVPD